MRTRKQFRFPARSVIVSSVAFGLLATSLVSVVYAGWGVIPIRALPNFEEMPGKRFMLDGANEGKNSNYGGEFIIPNEFENFLHYRQISIDNPVLPNSVQTAVVSVGGIRAFNTAAALRRDYLFAIDRSYAVNQFNVVLGNMILTLSREEFLKAILGTSLDIKTREDFLSETSKQLETDQRSTAQSSNDFVTKLYEMLPEPSAERPSQSIWRAWLFQLKKYAKDIDSWQSTFFGTQDSYSHIQKLIRDGHFFVIEGSIAGDTAVAKIGSLAKSTGIFITEFDVSNAFEYFPNGNVAIKKTLENAELLPQLDSRGLNFLVTVDKTTVSSDIFLNEPKGQLFYYLVRSFDSMKRTFDSFGENKFLVSTLLEKSAQMKILRQCSRIFLVN